MHDASLSRCPAVPGDGGPGVYTDIGQGNERSVIRATLIVVLLTFLVGGDYYGHKRYGGPGLGGVLGLVFIVWLFRRTADRPLTGF